MPTDSSRRLVSQIGSLLVLGLALTMLTPVAAHAQTVRATLTWDTATDVDLHIWDAQGNHAWYGDPNGIPGAVLSVDQTQGFGPETFTETANEGRSYVFCVHYFSGEGATTTTLDVTDPGGGQRTLTEQLAIAGVGKFVTDSPAGSRAFTPPETLCGTLEATTTTTIRGSANLTYGQGRSINVDVSSASGTPTGSVKATLDGQLLGTFPLTNGRATFQTPADLTMGNHTLVVEYPGAGSFRSSSASRTLVVKARSTISGRLSSAIWKAGTRPWINGKLTVTPTAAATGPLRLVVDGAVTRSFQLSASMNNAFYLKLNRMAVGTHTIQLKYLGSASVMPSASGVANVRIIP